MLSPIDSPPASLAPRFAASISPGPPPVITVYPCLLRQAAVSRLSSYQGWSSVTRAEPKIETPSSTSRRASKAVSISARMRSRRFSSSASMSLGTRRRRSSEGKGSLLESGRDRSCGPLGVHLGDVDRVALELPQVVEFGADRGEGAWLEQLRIAFAPVNPFGALRP